MLATRPSISLATPHITNLFIVTVALLCIPATASLGRFVDIQSQIGETGDVHISFPVIHGSSTEGYRAVIARQALDFGAANVGNYTPSSGELRSELITLDEPAGQYFAVLQLGTPPQEIAVIIDTGSEFLWVQCLPCTQCGIQIRDPIFDPAASTTYRSVSCASTSTCPADEGIASTCNLNTGVCNYGVTYGDNSTSIGVLSEETLTIGTTKGPSIQLTEVLFGCGNTNTGLETKLNSSGLMGLDRGNLSLPSQLGVNKFSYCLPDRVKDVNSSGYIMFGNSTVSEKLQYTPLLQIKNASSFGSQFYYLNMTGVSVNQNLLKIPVSAFEMDDEGNGGTVIDSGTTLTSFVDVAYTVVADAFESAMNLSSVDLGDGYDVCYKVPISQQKPPDAPNVTLHFDGPVDVELQTDQLLVLVGNDTAYNYYCMAFNNAGNESAARNYFGNYQQQNFLVEYDVGNSRVGFASTQCTFSASTSSASPASASSPSPTTSSLNTSSSASSLKRWNVYSVSLFGIFQTILLVLF